MYVHVCVHTFCQTRIVRIWYMYVYISHKCLQLSFLVKRLKFAKRVVTCIITVYALGHFVFPCLSRCTVLTSHFRKFCKTLRISLIVRSVYLHVPNFLDTTVCEVFLTHTAYTVHPIYMYVHVDILYVQYTLCKCCKCPKFCGNFNHDIRCMHFPKLVFHRYILLPKVVGSDKEYFRTCIRTVHVHVRTYIHVDSCTYMCILLQVCHECNDEASLLLCDGCDKG